MTLVFKLVTTCSLVLLVKGQLNYENAGFIPDYMQTQSTYTPTQQLPAETNPENPLLSLQFQPPKPDAPQPFYAEEPSLSLKAPSKEAVSFNYDLGSYPPEPAEELQLPSIEKWNPNNDPNLFYVVQTDIPTSLYPKKFTKEPKILTSKTQNILTDADVAAKQKIVEKVLLSLAKQENKKRLERERLKQEQEQLESQESYVEEKVLEEQVNDPLPSESGFVGFSSQGVAGNAVNHGLSHDGDRMEFQVHGHDGPKTYKWGYDTGKGHNRQFRYEEKNKDGYVTGHYGYVDKHGKLRMVNYDSHPHEGFHASEANAGSF